MMLEGGVETGADMEPDDSVLSVSLLDSCRTSCG